MYIRFGEEICGSVVSRRRGASLMVWAIAEGRKAARQADEFLMGLVLLPG